MSYSQLQQDLLVLQHYPKNLSGYYVDIGASDGIELSNTYLLERVGWKGICVEVEEESYKKLLTNRSCLCVNSAVYSVADKELTFRICKNDRMLSGLENTIDKLRVKDYTTKKVKTETLTQILDRANAPNFIEYLSLDVEGGEYNVLRGIDFDKYTFGLIHLEHNYKEINRMEIRNFLTEKGYIFVAENKWDDIYKKNM